MKQCLRCSNMLTANASHCNVCNTIQKENFAEFDLNRPKTDTFLKVLCVLTIVGAGFSLISLPFDFIAAAKSGFGYNIGLMVFSAILVVMKLVGAIFMLKKKLSGLYIYTTSAVCGIFVVIFSEISVGSNMAQDYVTLSIIINFFFVFLFLVLYWLPVNRRVLS